VARKKVEFKDRVKDFRRVPASELNPNPSNWRSHPKRQRDAMAGVLSEVGFADAVIARECEDGSLELIDGHMRVEAAPNSKLPVLVLDVTEDEARYLLATFDPISAMIETDSDALSKLLDQISTEDDGVKSMLDDMIKRDEDGEELTDAYQPNTDPSISTSEVSEQDVEGEREDLENQFSNDNQEYQEVICPNCGEEFSIG